MAAVTPGHDHDDGGYGLNVLKRLRTPTKVRESSHPRRTAEENFADMAKESDVDQAIELAVQRWKRRAKITFVVVAVCLVVAAIVDLACHDNVRGWLEDSFDWIEENPEAGKLDLIARKSLLVSVRRPLQLCRELCLGSTAGVCVV